MPDPFEALRTAPTPIEPDPAFVARLRTRVERALRQAQGVDETMPSLIHDLEPAAERVRQGDITYVSLWVPNVQRAAAFFASALGWTYAAGNQDQSRQAEGLSVSHGIAGLGAALRDLSSRGLDIPAQEHTTLYPVFAVEDINAAVERVRKAGGQALAPEDRPYGRLADCVDDQDMLFGLHEALVGLPRAAGHGTRHGDVSYLTFKVRDSARARAFLGAVLGLRFSPGRVEDGWAVNDLVPMSGLHGGQDRTAVVPMYRVDDIRSAIERVRALGGTATPPTREPYGLTADCTDDQGTHFYLRQ